jgi:uracil phosphoribosyltransferase
LYYAKLPVDVKDRYVLLLDPMVATGGSALKAIEVILEHGVEEDHVIFLTIISTKDGLSRLLNKFPKIRIVTAEIDDGVNANHLILPGLGDFGSRYFGTEKDT